MGDKRAYKTLGATTKDKVSYYTDNYKKGDTVKGGAYEWKIDWVKEDTKNVYHCIRYDKDRKIHGAFHSMDLQKVK